MIENDDVDGAGGRKVWGMSEVRWDQDNKKPRVGVPDVEEGGYERE